MNKEYIYESSVNKNYTDSESIIIVLPDIFGQTNYSKATCDEFAKAFKQPVFLIDYFYQLTQQATNISEDNSEVAVALMQKMSGNDFIQIFEKALEEIIMVHDTIHSVCVIGFCFGGRLSYISGINPVVKKIVSFYGAGSHQAGFVDDGSALEALIETRNHDKSLRVLSFYGSQDATISVEDQQKTQQLLADAAITYQAQVYNTGHAYFQPGRASYNKAAADASWQVLKDWLYTN